MKDTIIYGASDDLIEIEGGGHYEEFGASNLAPDERITCSDGTVLRPIYNGDWDFEVEKEGTAFGKKIDAVGQGSEHDDYPNASSNSAIVVFDEPVAWIKFSRADQTSERNPNRLN